VVFAVFALPGCSDDCGPHGAAVDGLSVMGNGVQIGYQDLAGSPNHDCPDAQAPLLSLTITGTQIGGVDKFTVCVPRPDKLEGGLAFGTSAQLVDVSASDASCSYVLDMTQPPSGTIKGAHVCDNGTNKAGFAMTVDGSLALTRTCGPTIDSVAVALTGTVAVAGPP